LWLRIILTIPVLTACWIFAGMFLLTKAHWLPVGAPALATVLCGISSHSLMFIRERRDRRAIYSLMEQHLSPEVTRAIWEHNEALLKGQGPPPEMIVATAMFADLKGYSGITADFQGTGRNREFIEWLNRYLQSVIPLIRAENGFVQQFAGDGIFVIFGFPASRDGNHAAQAVRCAKAIAGKVTDLNRVPEPASPPYHARIGIYTGEIICGSVGDQSHASYSFFGSTINKAARLESLQKAVHEVETEPVRILASDSTRLAAGESAAMIPFLDGPVILDPNLPPEAVWKVS
jgi:adenylate cyclase